MAWSLSSCVYPACGRSALSIDVWGMKPCLPCSELPHLNAETGVLASSPLEEFNRRGNRGMVQRAAWHRGTAAEPKPFNCRYSSTGEHAVRLILLLAVI